MEDILHTKSNKLFHPGLSVDCVIFGFYENQLKVLLLRMKHAARWSLPGGFVLKEENVDDAAIRILESRTGLDNIFLRQFYLFGDMSRNDNVLNREVLRQREIEPTEDHWFLQRFVSVGYYALVNFQTAVPRPDPLSDACAWWDLADVPDLIIDHNQILSKALETLRQQLNSQPIGYNLLPGKFTMPELQRLYETILAKRLDRRNFQRKMLGYGILKRLEERKSGVAHKAPYLYMFDTEKYQSALQNGLQEQW
jgi:ADP-ribose pyrophosphatase YjhB (NUDIX family)